MLLDHSDMVQVDALVNCKVFVAASCEAVFVRECRDCEITLACKQLRTRDCTNRWSEARVKGGDHRSSVTM